MSLNGIYGDLDRVRKIMDGWQTAENVSDIERELVLDKLKSVYEQVMFFEREEPMQWLDVQLEPVLEDNRIVEPRIEPVSQNHVEQGYVYEPIAVQQQEPVEQEIQSQSPQEQVLADQKLFDVEQIAKHKANRSVILSLYGDVDSAKSVKPFTQYRTTPAEINEPNRDVVMSVSEVSYPAEYTIVADQPHTKALGDVMNIGGQTIGDMAPRGGNKTDLRKSIGINDKFLMISEIFDGKADDYERAIDQFDKFTDLDDAMIFIHDNYHWNPNNEGVKLLVELLSRKLS